jgi:hypothetical protein
LAEANKEKLSKVMGQANYASIREDVRAGNDEKVSWPDTRVADTADETYPDGEDRRRD